MSGSTPSAFELLQSTTGRQGYQPLLQRVVYDGWDFALLLPYVEGFNLIFKEPAFRGFYIRERGPL